MGAGDEDMVAGASKRVLITRPQPLAERTAAALMDMGVEPVMCPLHHIAFPKFEPHEDPKPTAILLSSQNALPGLVALKLDQETPIFAVGSATAAAVRVAGFRAVHVAEGSAQSLLELFCAVGPKKGRALYLSGQEVRLDLSTALGQRGYDVRRYVVYETQSLDHLPHPVREGLRLGSIGYALFYSLANAKLFKHLVSSEDIQDLQAICLSSVIADGLRGLKGVTIHVVEPQEDRAMIEMVRQHMRQQEGK
ncbi:MAG: uroporphyrinogen-III synthase [Holosporales bacterium]